MKMWNRIIRKDILSNDDGCIEYGKQIIQTLADCLTEAYGKGFDFSSLHKYLKFYYCAYPILSWGH